MQCLILHVNGSPRQNTTTIVEAVNDFIAMNIARADGFAAYYAGRIYVASTDELNGDAINKRLKGAEICVVLDEFQHHIFIDCREPKITVAGWYSGPFMFGKNFPRCEFTYMHTPLPLPLARYAQFYIRIHGNTTELRICAYVSEWTGKITKACPHEKGEIRFISEVDEATVEFCPRCVDRYSMPAYVCGVAPETEFTMTGEGRHGEYTILGKDHYKYNLVDAKVIELI